MKIFLYYESTDQPHGGGNSFMRSFREECERQKIDLARDINEEYDILFFSGAMVSSRKPLSIDVLLEQKCFGKSGWGKRFLSAKKRTLIYRADGFRCFYAGLKNDHGDEIQRMALRLADHVILQNDFGLEVVRHPLVGFKGENYSIIHNGVDQNVFFMKEGGFWRGERPLRVLSVSWSRNLNKGHELIGALSRLPDVECTYCGQWPKRVDPVNVRILPPKKQRALADEYRKHDVFFHPSKKDMSPNVCLEAISCGLPIIYHATSGIRDVAGDCGVVLNEESLSDTVKEVKAQYGFFLEKIRQRRSQFSIERCVRDYMTVFQNVLTSTSER